MEVAAVVVRILERIQLGLLRNRQLPILDPIVLDRESRRESQLVGWYEWFDDRYRIRKHVVDAVLAAVRRDLEACLQDTDVVRSSRVMRDFARYT